MTLVLNFADGQMTFFFCLIFCLSFTEDASKPVLCCLLNSATFSSSVLVSWLKEVILRFKTISFAMI